MKKTISMIIVGTALTVSAQAELLVSWVTNTTDARTAQISPNYTADLGAASLSVVNYGNYGSNHGTSSGGGANFYVRGGILSLTSAGLGSGYVSFGVTSGVALNLDKLTLNIGATTGSSSVTDYPVTFTLSLLSSADHYAGVLATQALTYSTYITDGSTVAQPFDFSLGGLTVDSAVTFRLYITAEFPTGAVSNNDILRIYGMTLNGATAVPEPSMWALLGTGVVLLTLLRRKR